MGEISTDSGMDQWVCPNDRQLALRAKLGTGWSVHTNKFSSFRKSQYLSAEEQEQIMNVIQKADLLEMTEQERIGRLVEKLDNMKKNAMGNGTTQCVLCGDEFGLLGASPTNCDDCRKAVCTKCGVDTQNCQQQPLLLCKICSENREVWKRSGAWFFKGMPKYIIPEKKAEVVRQVGASKGRVEYRSSLKMVAGSPKAHNNWNRGIMSQGTAYGESNDHESTSSSEDDISIGKIKERPGFANDAVNLTSSKSGQINIGVTRPNWKREEIIGSNTDGHGQQRSIESSNRDCIRDIIDSRKGYSSASFPHHQSSGYSSVVVPHYQSSNYSSVSVPHHQSTSLATKPRDRSTLLRH